MTVTQNVSLEGGICNRMREALLLNDIHKFTSEPCECITNSNTIITVVCLIRRYYLVDVCPFLVTSKELHLRQLKRMILITLN